MRVYDILEKKRDGGELGAEEIRFIVDGCVHGYIPDYQLSAFLMAVFFRGMTDRETTELTLAMARSGSMLELGRMSPFTVDKHSSGGVGDKTTLIAAPIAASLGCCVPKMSGRGLGHTGGTLDKLDSIPGYRTSLTGEEFMDVVRSCGMAVIGQTADIAPADKILYSLRDVTATVDSIPLIASSIMSKKLASGADNIVLDVTVGSGAFMKDIVSAHVLAEKMVAIGKSCGKDIVAFITNMDEPLGRAVGNSLEVSEATDVLCGGGPDDLKEVSFALAAGMVALGFDIPHDDAMSRVLDAVESGAAIDKFRQWITAQGGDASFIEDRSLLPSAPVVCEYKAKMSGYISRMNAELVGKASSILGAGRKTYDDTIDHSAGITLSKKVGDRVEEGETIAVLHTSDDALLQSAFSLMDSAVEISDVKPGETTLIFDKLE